MRELADSTRTAADAAAAVGCEVGQIVKSLVFVDPEGPLLCLCAGDRRVDTTKLGADVRQANGDEVRDATRRASMFMRQPINSSVIPSAKKSCDPSLERLANARTASERERP